MGFNSAFKGLNTSIRLHKSVVLYATYPQTELIPSNAGPSATHMKRSARMASYLSSPWLQENP